MIIEVSKLGKEGTTSNDMEVANFSANSTEASDPNAGGLASHSGKVYMATSTDDIQVERLAALPEMASSTECRTSTMDCANGVNSTGTFDLDTDEQLSTPGYQFNAMPTTSKEDSVKKNWAKAGNVSGKNEKLKAVFNFDKPGINAEMDVDLHKGVCAKSYVSTATFCRNLVAYSDTPMAGSTRFEQRPLGVRLNAPSILEPNFLHFTTKNGHFAHGTSKKMNGSNRAWKKQDFVKINQLVVDKMVSDDGISVSFNPEVIKTT